MEDKELKPDIPAPLSQAKLTLPDGKEIMLPILEPTAGAPMIDMR